MERERPTNRKIAEAGWSAGIEVPAWMSEELGLADPGEGRETRLTDDERERVLWAIARYTAEMRQARDRERNQVRAAMFAAAVAHLLSAAEKIRGADTPG